MSRIKDIKLAPSGELKIKWVERNMPVLRGIAEDFKKSRPFEGMKVSARCVLTVCGENVVYKAKEI